MAVSVAFSEDPAEVLHLAGGFLGSRPVINQLMVTLLQAQVAAPEPGCYWVATDGGEVVGVVLQSAPGFPAVITPLPDRAVAPVVAAVAEAGVDLPGVQGDPGSAARFAGSWTERRRSGARPVEGHRIYEVERLVAATGVAGAVRPAGPDDRGLLVTWLRGFSADVGGIRDDDPTALVDRRLPGGNYWIWDDDGPVSMAERSDPACGVFRIRSVYTPPDRRRRGYAAACVAAVSSVALESGQRCILYTDLANPTSNGVYRRIGYRAVAESLRYEFTR